MVCDDSCGQIQPKDVPVSEHAGDGEKCPAASKSKALEPWMVAEAMRFFEERLLLEEFRQNGVVEDYRARMCCAQFRSLIEHWQPNSDLFWLHCCQFSKQWAPGDLGAVNRYGSPRARPLSAGRLNNYLTRLAASSAPDDAGGEVFLCTAAEKYFPVEVFEAANRFGIRLSDIRTTCDSVFEACKTWTGLEWGKDKALDPCPWPVPADLDGLRCCWRQLAQASGHDRVYLNPPWSKLDQWLYKAVCECHKGMPVLAVVPAWMTNVCHDIKQFSQILDIDAEDFSKGWKDVQKQSCRIDIQSRVLWDAEFAHPTSGSKMPPLNVLLVWMKCKS